MMKFKLKNKDLTEKSVLGKGASDSKMLYELFNCEGIIPVLQAYEGALAMMAFNRDGTLFVYHDDKRPLHLGYSEEGIYFHLKVIL